MRATVNVVKLDDYLKGVVAAEMPASWEQAALRAQAVAARTFATFNQAERAGSSYQICDTYSCQVYGGKSAEYPTTNEGWTPYFRTLRDWLPEPFFQTSGFLAFGALSAALVEDHSFIMPIPETTILALA